MVYCSFIGATVWFCLLYLCFLFTVTICVKYRFMLIFYCMFGCAVVEVDFE